MTFRKACRTKDCDARADEVKRAKTSHQLKHNPQDARQFMSPALRTLEKA
jgi:hypothetical protein